MTEASLPDDHDLWRWAEGIMSGTGVATRSGHKIVPVLHLLAEGDRMWCSGGAAIPFEPVKPHYCRECLTLAREMKEDLGDD